jgi:hypothetical protein
MATLQSFIVLTTLGLFNIWHINMFKYSFINTFKMYGVD